MHRRSKYFLFLFLTTKAFSDFSIPSDAALISKLSPALSGKTEFYDTQVKRLGKNTLEVECFAALHGEISLFKKIVPKYAEWRDWLLADINLPEPGADAYVFQFHDILQQTADSVVTVFSFNLPFFGKQRTRGFNVKKIETDKSLALLAETQLSENSVVKTAKAYLKAIQPAQPSQTLWVGVSAVVEFKSWMLYQALPEKVVLREVGERLKIISENYKKEENLSRTGTKRTTSALPATIPQNQD